MKHEPLTFSKWKQQALKNPSFKFEYEQLQPEMVIIKTMIEARIKKGLTQKELAQKIGTTQSVISRIESGRGNPTLHFLLKIAQAFESKLELKFS